MAEQAHAEGLVMAFGSNEVLDRMQAWREIIVKMINADKLIKLGLEHETEPSPRLQFAELQEEEVAARKATRGPDRR
jgi:hypothetical protein